MAAGAVLVWRRGDELGRALDQVSLTRLEVAGALAVAGTILIQLVWSALLRGLGAEPARRDAASVFFVSQLGKYVPGSVWPVVAQMQFGVRWRVPRAVMLAANVLLLGMVTASGLAVGAVLLPWSSPDGLRRYWWLLLLLLPLAAGLHPRTVPAVLDRLLRRLGRDPLPVRPGLGSLAASAGWALLAWLVLGLHVAVLAGAFGHVGVRELAAFAGGMGLAWAAGLAFIPAPAGAGVRDAVLVLTLSPMTGTTGALTVALASRALLLVADVLLAAVGALARPVGRVGPVSPS
ncbi:MAG: lysylphosphatidylglycerol synthase domain-containing protein [Nocardioides sp.]|uniref:lysylphosphatidylglycerol synthase domain-containing protein n=1 Tax=Nocardioides sp. TaxID=35761 RepID=UPI0039E3FDCD